MDRRTGRCKRVVARVLSGRSHEVARRGEIRHAQDHQGRRPHQRRGAHLDDYFRGLADTEEAEAVVLADPTGKTAAGAEKVLKAKLKNTYRDTARDARQEDPQMVLVSLEAALAPPVIDAALEAGCHVLCEKPSCVRAADFGRWPARPSRSTATSCWPWPTGSCLPCARRAGSSPRANWASSTAWKSTSSPTRPG